jgi:hypothetical protein
MVKPTQRHHVDPNSNADQLPITPEQAATALQRLINASPRSPTKAEIVAIIERAVATTQFGDYTISELDARIRDLVPKVRAASLEAGRSIDQTLEWVAAEAKVEQLEEHLHALEREAYAKPAVTMADVQTRATIAAYWSDDRDTVTTGHVGDGSGPVEWLDDKNADPYEHALARLLEAVLQVGERRGANSAA